MLCRRRRGIWEWYAGDGIYATYKNFQQYPEYIVWVAQC